MKENDALATVHCISACSLPGHWTNRSHDYNILHHWSNISHDYNILHHWSNRSHDYNILHILVNQRITF